MKKNLLSLLCLSLLVLMPACCQQECKPKCEKGEMRGEDGEMKRDKKHKKGMKHDKKKDKKHMKHDKKKDKHRGKKMKSEGKTMDDGMNEASY